jgi:hypothetical protein
VNWLSVALVVALPPEIADETADAAAEVASEVAVTTVVLTSEVAVTTVASEVAVTTVVLVSERAALLALSGMLMGTPAAEQVDSTAEMAAAWSAAEQAPSTQGWTDARRAGPFWQWQAKSVKLEQPSLVRGPTKQFN